MPCVLKVQNNQGMEKAMKNHTKTMLCSMAAALGLLAVPAVNASAADTAAPAASTWYTDEEGRIFYYGADKNAVTGRQIINGKVYLFSENGVLKTGWRTVDGQRCYYDPKTGKQVYGWLEYCGRQYYLTSMDGKVTGFAYDDAKSPRFFDENGSLVTENGFYSEDGECYYVDENGLAATENTVIEDIPYLISSHGEISTGWQTIDGKKYYFDETENGKAVLGKKVFEDGSVYYLTKDGAATGEVNENGVFGVFGEDGAQQFGWQVIGGKSYYFENDGNVKTGLAEIEGETYLFSSDGTQLLGWQDYNGSRYYFGINGIMQKGLLSLSDGIYNMGTDGKMQTGFAEFGGNTYYFGEDGKAVSGLKEIDGGLYCFSKACVMVNDGELTDVDGKKYVFGEDGKAVSGWQEIEGKKYFLGEDKAAVTGILTQDDHTYCFGDDCALEKYFVNTDGKITCFDASGNALGGWQEIAGSKYHFNAEGAADTGLTVIDGESYFFAEDGKMQTGFVTSGGITRYFGTDGKMLTGWQTISGKKYYFLGDGKMLTGRQIISGNKYYLDETGAMQTGWVTLADGKYYFGSDGVMLTGRQIINGAKYYLADNGVMQTGWVTLSDGKYYFGTDGKMVTGWQTISGKYYHFGTDGKLTVNTTLDGYKIDANGVATKLSAVQLKANTILASIGKTPNAIYNYVINNNKYRYIEDTRTLAQIQATGWSYFANYAMNNKYVVCYYFAAITDLLFQQAGLESRIVYGTGRGDGDHYWNQVKINGVWTNYDTCNMYANVTDAYLKTQGNGYTWKQYVYPTFN